MRVRNRHEGKVFEGWQSLLQAPKQLIPPECTPIFRKRRVPIPRGRSLHNATSDKELHSTVFVVDGGARDTELLVSEVFVDRAGDGEFATNFDFGVTSLSPCLCVSAP
jgi:hypothetical protein